MCARVCVCVCLRPQLPALAPAVARTPASWLAGGAAGIPGCCQLVASARLTRRQLDAHAEWQAQPQVHQVQQRHQHQRQHLQGGTERQGDTMRGEGGERRGASSRPAGTQHCEHQPVVHSSTQGAGQEPRRAPCLRNAVYGAHGVDDEGKQDHLGHTAKRGGGDRGRVCTCAQQARHSGTVRVADAVQASASCRGCALYIKGARACPQQPMKSCLQ